jgi:hypothetical protein
MIIAHHEREKTVMEEKRVYSRVQHPIAASLKIWVLLTMCIITIYSLNISNLIMPEKCQYTENARNMNLGINTKCMKWKHVSLTKPLNLSESHFMF